MANHTQVLRWVAVLHVVASAVGFGTGDAPDGATRDARVRAIERLVAACEIAPPKSPTEDEQIAWMQQRASAQEDLVASIEAFLSAYPNDPARGRLLSLQMDACFDAATIQGAPLTALEEIITTCDEAGESAEPVLGAARDAKYWRTFRTLQRLESHALRGQINTADRLAAMEGFALNHTEETISVPLMADLIEGWTRLGDYSRADDWMAVLRERHPNHVTTRAIEGRHLLQRSIGAVWRPELKDVTKQPINWQKFDGSVTVVIFWSPTHRLAAEAVDFVRQLDKSLAQNQLHVIAVSLDSDPVAAVKATMSQGSDWTVVCDGLGWSGPLPQDYGIRSLPTLLLLDGQGLLQRFWTATEGSCKRPDVEKAVRDLVGEWHAAAER